MPLKVWPMPLKALLCTFVLSSLLVAPVLAANDPALEMARILQYDKASSLDEIAKWTRVPPGCWSYVFGLNRKLLAYHNEAIRSTHPNSPRAKEAERIYSQIKSTLSTLEPGECFDPVARAYAVAAVTMLESSYDQALLKLAAYFAVNFPDWNFPGPGTSGTFVPRLQILTPSRRAKESGCRWSAPGKIYSYQYYGGYFCKSASIAIDPYLPPSNLGASFIHEIDHFLRDRLGRAGLSWDEVRELTVYDEVLSSALSAFYQLRLAQMPRKHVENRSWLWSFETTKSQMDEIPKRNGYQLAFDNNLFLKNGPLWSMLKDLKNPVLTNAKDFMQASGLLPCRLNDGVGNGTKWLTLDPRDLDKAPDPARVAEVFDRIYRAYFSQPMPLSYSSPAMYRSPSPQYRKACFSMSPSLALYGTADFSSLVLEPSHNVYALISLFHGELKKPSRACQTFQSATAFLPGSNSNSNMIDLLDGDSGYRGQLADYVRVCGHPGNEGGKTGNEGGKTGNEGGKTTFEVARPCMELPTEKLGHGKPERIKKSSP